MNPVVCGNARFSVVCPECVRIEWSDSGSFVDHPTLFAAKRKMDFDGFTVTKDDSVLKIRTSRFELTYRHIYGKLRDGVVFADILGPDGSPKGRWAMGAKNKENLGGTVDSLDGVGAPVDLGEGLLSRDGWHMVDDSASPLLRDGWLSARRDDERGLDMYLFAYGSEYKAALRALSGVSGKIPQPPRCVLGSWYSRWWHYTSKDYRDIVEEYESKGFPLDIMVMDMEWHRRDAVDGHGWGGTLGWTGWSWNRELLPDAEELLKYFKEKGLKVTLNSHPHDGVRSHEDMYKEFMADMGAPADGGHLPFDAGDKKYMEAYFKHTHAPLERAGVDFWWVDWQQDPIMPFIKSMPGQRHLQWLNWLYYNHTAGGGRRGLSFSRWGGWGDQRHPIYFSGDVVCNWDMLAFEVPFTAVAGNVGCFFWSHDMGGFHGERDGEMYARWLQFGCSTASMRCHSAGEELDRRPWKWDAAHTESMRLSFELRARLMPYVCASVRRACEDTTPLNRPMWLEHPDAPEAYLNPQQYYFGDSLLVAPVVSPSRGGGVGFQTVWFPEGEWFDFFSGERFSGGAETVVGAGLDEFPMYVRAGVPLPLAEPSQRMTSDRWARLAVTVFPAAVGTRRSFVLYEDDGETTGYQRGEFRETELSYERTAAGHVVEIHASKGSFPGALERRAFTVELRGVRSARGVKINGKKAEFEFLADSVACRVALPESPVGTGFRVEIDAEVEDAAAAGLRAFRCRAEKLLGHSVGGDSALDVIVAEAGSPRAHDLLLLAGCGFMLKNEHKFLLPGRTALKFYPGRDGVRADRFSVRHMEESSGSWRELSSAECVVTSPAPTPLPEFNNHPWDDRRAGGRLRAEMRVSVGGREILFTPGRP